MSIQNLKNLISDLRDGTFTTNYAKDLAIEKTKHLICPTHNKFAEIVETGDVQNPIQVKCCCPEFAQIVREYITS
ncbi:MAG: hypothetical protein LBE82_11735 [Chitinophagaceae bacterium]|nr:hypothetical protein [Chitinophagaceae bacterium]